ncbi:MAG: hypothetical protein ACOYEP_00665 [Limnochordia bacterium]|jgi:hypothetical protein
MIGDSHRDAQVRRFVLGFLRACGAQTDGRRVRLPGVLARHLQVDEQLELSFVPTSSGEAEYITHGHPLLDRMIALSMSRGATSSLLCGGALAPEFLHLAFQDDPFSAAQTENRQFAWLKRTLRRVSFPKSQPRIVARSLSYHLQLLFGFRVALVSDEKREQLMHILMDPITESADSLIDVDEAISFVPVTDRSDGFAPSFSEDSEPEPLETVLSRANEGFPPHAYATLRLYRKACQILEERLQEELRKFKTEADRRLKDDLERIETYYAGLAQEALDPLRRMFRHMATSSVRMQLARSYENEKRYTKQLHLLKQRAEAMEADYKEETEELQAEMARRRSELTAKYRIRAEVRLISCAAVRVPRLTFTLRFSHPASREISLVYDVLRARLVDHICDACEQPLSASYFCDCGDLVCSNCFQSCVDCGRDMCESCAASSCHVCGERLCSDCGNPCPSAAMPSPSVTVCTSCHREICSSCLNLVSGIGDW